MLSAILTKNDFFVQIIDFNAQMYYNDIKLFSLYYVNKE